MKNDLRQIDHLIYTVSNLEQGIKEIETLLGMEPIVGGRHPDYGTHNALVSLGGKTYLEIMAPDPKLPAPDRGRLFEHCYQKPPGLATWVLRAADMEDLHARAIENGIDLGPVTSGSREQLDGTLLTWKLTDPYAFPCEGALPFLISWGDTPHPAKTAPRAGKLIGFEIEHPNPELIRSKLQVLDIILKVKKAEEVRLIAKIQSGMEIVTLG